ncbi:MAG: nitroreductase family protein [Methanotrichaceae archaeon]|nr:nitroreductase family protein [Methanotrichaceae archaeon]
MDVMEALRQRRSIRSFQSRPVEDEVLAKVLEAGRLAPSARNLQNWRFIVVRAEETRRLLASAAKGQTFVGEAPVVIAACGTETEYVMTCGQPAYAINVAIAVDHMTLAAAALGLGSCWIGAFYEDRAKEILGVPPEARIVCILALGYPGATPPPTRRKGLDELVAWESW